MSFGTNNRGFSLIETIIYLALFAILFTGLISATFTLSETSGRNQSKAMLQEEKDFLIGKINWVLSGAQTVSTPGANASATTLQVTKYSGVSNAVALSGSNVTLNGVVINNSNVSITKLIFIHTYAGGTNPESVEAGFTISTKTSTGASIFQTASTTRYIRK